MVEGRLIILGLVTVSLVHILQTRAVMKDGNLDCSATCGSINISFPFRLEGDPIRCGYRELACQNNRTTLYLAMIKYYVQGISYKQNSIRLVDATLNNDYCTVPLRSFPFTKYDTGNLGLSHFQTSIFLILSCSVPINSSNYVDFSPCIHPSSTESQYRYTYATAGIHLYSDIHDSCNTTIMYPMDRQLQGQNLSISYLHKELLRGFELRWGSYFRCSYNGISCTSVYKPTFVYWLIMVVSYWWSERRARLIAFVSAIAGFVILRASVGIVLLIVFWVYTFRRRHLCVDDSIEDFLQRQNNFMPIRYSFEELKKMTNGFKDKLGQGGFGTVYKAKLRSGRLVAIKLLGNSKANGQDFINEVATIGRIHHVNVVQLIGFCVEGSKRALVYDYMPNGSLDKFLFHGGENETLLSWERTCDIALGVARGIEYLHRGCDMQILHFDIKPHNILLGENFVPKVSDFGLAKLYPTDDSIVSLTAARGTLGYIAPELFYKNIGGVSYKADVYSFGMLLMEMVGRRRNTNPYAEHSSQVYFPSWIYDHMNQGEDMDLGSDVTEQVQKLVRKMTIVAIWCIQMKPGDRPSMSKVLEMLEGDDEVLQIPPKPYFHPQDNPTIIDQGLSSSTSFYNSDMNTNSSIC